MSDFTKAEVAKHQESIDQIKALLRAVPDALLEEAIAEIESAVISTTTYAKQATLFRTMLKLKKLDREIQRG